jgi:hypothetical protein
LRQCTACQLSGTDVPKIYIKEGSDGLGSRLHDIIAGVAIAAKSRMALAGVSVGRKACGVSHGINILEAAGSFFGLQDPNLMFKFEDPDTGYCQVHLSAKSFLDTLKKYGMPGSNCNILISSNSLARDLSVHGSASSWYTPRLRQELRNGFIWKKPLAFNTGSTSIAIHIRRGDVKEGFGLWEARGTSDQWRFSLIAQLKTLVPRADIHVFSNLEGDSSSSEYDGYRARGATVHLDEADPIETWAHLVAADVFVMAKSSFSYVPALLNDNCLVYQGFWHTPLDGWVSAQADEEAPLDAAAEQKLRGCISGPVAQRCTLRGCVGH